MLHFFQKDVFIVERLFEYLLLDNCEMYIGGNRDKILQIWTGEGDNGKSVTNKIIRKQIWKTFSEISKRNGYWRSS